jgi:histidinol-phosphate aminotransferase
MNRDEIVWLAGDVPAVVGRRRFLGLLSAGVAAAGIPVAGLTRPASGGEALHSSDADWMFEEPPIVLDQDPDRALLDQNENPFAPSPVEREALIEALNLANRYPDAEGRLVDRLAAHHEVQERNLLMGCGSSELLKIGPDAVIGSGKELVEGFPTYPTAARYTRVRGGEVISVPVDEMGRLDLEAMGERLNGRTEIVYLCNPNNPTGGILSDSTVRAFLGRIPERVLVIVDEAYHDYVDDPGYRTLIPLAVERSNLIVLRTFSKVYGLAGMRIGYGIATAETVRRLQPHRLTLDLNNPAIYAAMAALDDEELYGKTVAMNDESRRAIIREMPRFGGRPVPSQGGFVWIAFDRETGPILRGLREHHVHVRTYSHSPRHLRISTGTPRDMDRLFDAMEKVV